MITAGAGNDNINAGQGDDIIDGGEGDDYIVAGLGSDVITGGAGRDTFTFNYADFYDEYIDVITDFQIGASGDLLDLSDIHEQSLADGFGDSWAGTEWAHHHGYINFRIDGEDTLVSYDQDGLYDEISAKDFIRLEGVQLTSLTSDNIAPAPSDALYLITPASTLSEDSGASISYRVVLGREPTDDVSIQITGGEQIYVNGSSEPITLTFTSDNWFKSQEVFVTAIDDREIEQDHSAPLTHLFSSSDARFDGIQEDLSVLIKDNDFQRSVSGDMTKLPTAGTNGIIYDLDLSANSQWYSHSHHNNLSLYANGTFPTSAVYSYQLDSGSDYIEISSGLQEAINDRHIVFFGDAGEDEILYANYADGGSGNDTLEASNVQSTSNHLSSSQY